MKHRRCIYDASFPCKSLFYAVFADPISVDIEKALAGHTNSSTGMSGIAIKNGKLKIAIKNGKLKIAIKNGKLKIAIKKR